MRFMYRNQEWHWNGFFGMFFQPVSPTRRRERVCREGSPLFDKLRSAANYP